MYNFIDVSNNLPDLSIGKYPGSRKIEDLLNNGIINLDKWSGPTSRDVVSIIKKHLEREKVGHSGTLDPMVTGVLPLALDNACKVMPAIQKQDKEYVGIMKMHKEIKNSELIETTKKIIGTIIQKPPVRSAVMRKERPRTVHSFDILEINEKDVLFKIVCEAGTYVRLICHKIGEKIGGAHMKELRRTRAGSFSNPVKIQDVIDAYISWKETGNEEIRKYILPVEAAINNTKKIFVKNSSVYSISKGSPLYSKGISKIEKGIEKNNIVALMTMKGELIALGKAVKNSESMKNGLTVKTDRVIIQNNDYEK